MATFTILLVILPLESVFSNVVEPTVETIAGGHYQFTAKIDVVFHEATSPPWIVRVTFQPLIKEFGASTGADYENCNADNTACTLRGNEHVTSGTSVTIGFEVTCNKNDCPSGAITIEWCLLDANLECVLDATSPFETIADTSTTTTTTTAAVTVTTSTSAVTSTTASTGTDAATVTTTTNVVTSATTTTTTTTDASINTTSTTAVTSNTASTDTDAATDTATTIGVNSTTDSTDTDAATDTTTTTSAAPFSWSTSASPSDVPDASTTFGVGETTQAVLGKHSVN